MIYVYDEDSRNNKTFNSTGSLWNKITGDEYKKAYFYADDAVKKYSAKAKFASSAENSYRKHNPGVIQDETTQRYNGMYNRSKQLADKNRSSRSQASAAYRDTTIAGGLGKLKNKVNLTV